MAFKRFTKVTFYEFQAPSWTAISYLHDLQDFWNYRQRSKNELIEAGMDMARLHAAYTLRNQRADAIEDEISRLEAFFRLPEDGNFRYEVARVIRRDMNQWWQTLTIRKGRIHGVQPGQAVVFTGGVVGRVKEVYQYTAIIELISSPRFRTAAHVQGDLRPVEFQGGLNPGMGHSTGIVRTVPADIRLSERSDLRLVSSRLGGVFPDGLYLGTIQSLKTDEDGLFQEGIVRLSVDLNTVREVAVLIPLESQAFTNQP
jgi:rod shape-determining protein MreC